MKTKKFLSLVLSAAMILGVAVPVAAEPVSAGQGVEAEQQPIVENSITSGYILSDLDYNTPVYEPDEAVPYSDDWGYSADEKAASMRRRRVRGAAGGDGFPRPLRQVRAGGHGAPRKDRAQYQKGHPGGGAIARPLLRRFSKTEQKRSAWRCWTN